LIAEGVANRLDFDDGFVFMSAKGLSTRLGSKFTSTPQYTSTYRNN